MSVSNPQLVPPRSAICPIVCPLVHWQIGFPQCAFGLSLKSRQKGIHYNLLKYPRVGHSKRPLLLREWCFGLRRKCVRTFLAALCYRASRAGSVGLCPLAPDGRTTIACPCLRPQAIALSVLCRSARFCRLPFARVSVL